MKSWTNFVLYFFHIAENGLNLIHFSFLCETNIFLTNRYEINYKRVSIGDFENESNKSHHYLNKKESHDAAAHAQFVIVTCSI